MKKGIITILIITMLVSIGLVSCKNEVQAPDDYLVSVSFENGSSRMLSSNLEGFEPGSYFWKYAAKKADASNLLSGQTANYDNDGREAGAQWIAEGQPGFGTIIGEVITPFRVQGFSQGLWNFTLYGYKWTDLNEDDVKDPNEFNLVYSGEITSVLLKQGGPNHVRAVVSPAQGGTGTLLVKISGTDAIYLDRAFPVAEAANTKIRLKVELVGSSGDPLFNGFVTEDYIAPLESGAYKVTVEFTNDDGEIVYAAGSVVSTVYSNLTTTIKGNLTEIITSADFGADQNPDIITTTIGTASITQGTTDSSVTFTSTSTTVTKVTASMPTSAAKSLIEKMEQALDAKTSTPESETSDLTLNLSVNTTEATETTVTYEIGMEATLVYEKKDAQSSEKTTTKSTVETLDDFVTVQIELQRGLTDVRVKHSDDYMTECESLEDLNSKTKTSEGAAAGFFFYQDPYVDPDNGVDTTKAMLYIRTYRFSPFTLSYTIPTVAATVGSKTFNTLEEAFALQDTDDEYTIVLQKSIDVYYDTMYAFTINSAKSVSLELNGYAINGYASNSGTTAFFRNLGTFIIMDSTDSDKDGSGQGAITSIAYDPDLTVDPYPSYASNTIRNEGKLIVESGLVKSLTNASAAYAIDSYATNSEVIIRGGKIYHRSSDAIRLFCNSASKYSNLTIEGGVVEGYGGVWIQLPGTDSSVNPLVNVVVSGGEFKSTSNNPSEDDTVFHDYSYGNGVDNFSLSISGGTYNGAVGLFCCKQAVISNGLFTGNYVYCANSFDITGGDYNVATMYFNNSTISGGVFNVQPGSSHIADGYFAKEINGRYHVIPVSDATDEDYVAYVLDQGYLSFNSARTASNGSPIKLNKDISGSVSFSDGQSYILDLNGHSISVPQGASNVDAVNVYKSTTLVITDSSTGTKGSISSVDGHAIWTGNDETDASSITINGEVNLIGKTHSIQSEEGSSSVVINSAIVLNGFDINETGSLAVKGGTYGFDPTAYLADGYYAEHHAAEDPNPEYWIVKHMPDAPMAKVVRYFVDKTNPTDIGYAEIKYAEVVKMDLSTDGEEIPYVLPILSTYDENQLGQLLNAVLSGTLVSFLPVNEYSSQEEYSDIDEYYRGWRADFKIIANNDFPANSIGLVGAYGLFSNVLNFDITESVDSGYWVMLMSDVGSMHSERFYVAAPLITYETLLSKCATSYLTEDHRNGFNCGAYALSEGAYGKSITVQLILTNDSIETDPEKIVDVVCAEVTCTFHEPVIPGDVLETLLSSFMDNGS